MTRTVLANATISLNLEAAEVSLDAATLARIDDIARAGAAEGASLL